MPDIELPPGQYVTDDFPLEAAGTPPTVRTDEWTFSIVAGGQTIGLWDWPSFQALPHEPVNVDLHSEHGWSKLATEWHGVPLSGLFDGLDLQEEFVRVDTFGEYSTNLPLEDLLEMPTWLVDAYQGEPLTAERGGPARLLVPHLYLWKSAMWIRSITATKDDQPGTRERGGRHNYGDPWRQQRFRND
jgi:DMSO/TMAO reductase YedYZ molybdopterin-dependent catalytic subunit